MLLPTLAPGYGSRMAFWQGSDEACTPSYVEDLTVGVVGPYFP